MMDSLQLVVNIEQIFDAVFECTLNMINKVGAEGTEITLPRTPKRMCI